MCEVVQLAGRLNLRRTVRARRLPMTGPPRDRPCLILIGVGCDDSFMDAIRGVVGVELSPIFVVAPESEAFVATEQDYVQGVSVRQLIDELQPDQHIYLVHLDNPGPGLGVKLTRLT